MCLKPGADFYCTSFQHRFLEPVHWNTQTRSKNKANCSVALCDLLAMEKLPSSLGSVTDIRNCTQTVLNSCDSFLSLQSLVSVACRTVGVGSQRNRTLRPTEPTVQHVFWRFVTCWQWKITKQAIRCQKWKSCTAADFSCTSFQHRFLEPVHWNTQTRSKNKANCSVALCDLLAMEKLPSSLGSVTDIRNCTQTVLNSCDSFLSLQSLVSVACRTVGVGSQRNQTLRPTEPTVQYVFWRFVTCWQWKITKQAIRCQKWKSCTAADFSCTSFQHRFLEPVHWNTQTRSKNKANCSVALCDLLAMEKLPSSLGSVTDIRNCTQTVLNSCDSFLSLQSLVSVACRTVGVGSQRNQTLRPTEPTVQHAFWRFVTCWQWKITKQAIRCQKWKSCTAADFSCTSFQHRFVEPVHWNTQAHSKNKANCSVALCDLLAMDKLPSSLGSVTDIRNCTQTVLNSCDSFLSLQSLVSVACRTGGVGSQRNQTLRPTEPTVQHVFWRFVTCWQWKITKQAIRCQKWKSCTAADFSCTSFQHCFLEPVHWNTQTRSKNKAN